MRERIAIILFVIILAFIAVFSTDIFNRLFIEVDSSFTNTASAAFFGAFLAFIFVRLGDFFKAYSDRVSKNHNGLIKLQHTLNNLLNTLDDNVYIIETFESLYDENIVKPNKKQVFVWANRLRPSSLIGDLIIDLLNIDLINELFNLNAHLRKLNESMDTINGAYTETKDALISGKIDPNNYLENLKMIHKDLGKLKSFINSNVSETTESLAAIRVLGRRSPLLGYLLRKLPGHKYSKDFEIKRSKELLDLHNEIKNTKEQGQDRIDNVLRGNKKNS